MGSRCYPDASVSPILFPPSPIFRFSRATADAQWTPPHPSRRGRGGGVGWGLGNQTHAKCNDVDQKSSISLRDFACFSAGRRAGSTRQQNEVKKTRAVGKCFLAIAWLRCPNNETRPRLHAWQALWGCCISQATLAVAQFSGQGKRLPNCTAILCSCAISLPLFSYRSQQAKSAKRASAHDPNAQQSWFKLGRTLHQNRQDQPNTVARAHGEHLPNVHRQI